MKVKLESLVTTHPTIVSSSVKDTFTEVLFEIYVDKVVEIVFEVPIKILLLIYQFILLLLESLAININESFEQPVETFIADL